MVSFDKVDVVQHLARLNGYTRYLEIATSTTGFRFAAARAFGFETCLRLLYRCPPTFEDGQPVDFRSPDLDTSSCLAILDERCPAFDIVFLDPHHTYECSARDLSAAFALIRDGGAIVVHDCDPPTAEIASPDFHLGPWCGVQGLHRFRARQPAARILHGRCGFWLRRHHQAASVERCAPDAGLLPAPKRSRAAAGGGLVRLVSVEAFRAELRADGGRRCADACEGEDLDVNGAS